MNVGLMQIAEIFCPVMTKIKYMYTTTRACTQSPTLAFLAFLCHKYAQASFFFESLDPSMMKPYRLVIITNVRGACAFVQSRRITQSFGVDEEYRHLRTPTN